MTRVEPPWPVRAVLALERLPGKSGTPYEIYGVVESIYHDLDGTISHGFRSRTKWQNCILEALRISTRISQTGTKRRPDGAVKSQIVWQLNDEHLENKPRQTTLPTNIRQILPGSRSSNKQGPGA